MLLRIFIIGHFRNINIQADNEVEGTKTIEASRNKCENIYISSTFFCVFYSLNLSFKLNFNISKVGYWTSLSFYRQILHAHRLTALKTSQKVPKYNSNFQKDGA